ncbi:MAG: T9SS type A sorting domain-containing protein [Urechidicola sp.]|nr:T9SS type A sorting domain-containing protein [Urechidicola sp.]
MKNQKILFITVLMSGVLHLNSQVQLTIEAADKSHTIHPMIQGHGLVYSEEDDAIYNDGSMAQLYKDVGAGFLRWPGGTVSTMYHWDDLSGVGWIDNWNPSYNSSSDRDASEYMDLDEYITLSNAAETEPMLGINMSSGMEWDREADALQEAQDMITYCLNNNFNVKYFYLDNETYHEGNGYNKDVDGDGGEWTPQLYAEKINLYADAIKSIVPNAILIANWKDKLRTNTSAYNTLINVAGDNIDYIDVHWYWKWGVATWDAWKATTPMQNDTEWYDGGTFVEEIEFFNDLTATLGKPHIKLAALEWNIAPGDFHSDPNHTEFMQALMQSEMQMQFIQGGLELASMWTTQWANYSDSEFMTLVDSDNNYNPTPSAKIFELYKNAINGEVVSSTISDNQLMTTTVLNGDKVYVYILSKDDATNNVEFTFNDIEVLSVAEAKRFTDPGVLQDIGLWTSGTTGKYLANIPANTLTMVAFNRDMTQNLLVNGDFEDALNNWTLWNSPTTTSDAFEGSSALNMFDKGSIYQWVTVEPNSEYTLSAYLKTSNAANRVVMGIADENDVNQETTDVYDTSYALHQITFTSDSDQTQAKVWIWQPPSVNATANVDDIQLIKTLNPLSISDELLKNKLKIYPNPAFENIIVSIDNFIKVKRLELYNSLGQKMYDHDLNSAKNDFTIAVSKYSRGLYFLVVTDENEDKASIKLVLK